MFKVAAVVLDDKTRAELEARARSTTMPVRDVQRARIILLCAEGVSIRQIGLQVGLGQHRVGAWRKRFIAEGLDGLNDEQRSGRPRRLGHDERIKIAAIATSEKPDDDPVATWTYPEVTAKLNAEGMVVSVSQVWRILTKMDIDLNKVRGWLNRRDDPDFWDRVRDVCGLYLNPPGGAIVLSADEKTAIQARSPKYADQPAREGRHRRREFEYGRHGTVSLFAAMDVHSGQVLAEPIDGKNDSINFCAFLAEIDRVVDPNLEIHVVLDNGSSHRSKYTTAWFEEHPRWVAHFTPPHASWVNQVELFFSILQRKVIRGGRFDSRDDLVTKLLTFIADYDQTARPFKWTYAADPLKAA